MAHEIEKKAFDELKKRMKGDMDSDLYEDDNVFNRFLKARDFKVDNAEAMLRKHLEWRKKYDVKNLLQFESPEVLKKYFQFSFIGHAKHGQVFRYVPVGNTDYKGLLASCIYEDFWKHVFKYLEEDLAKMKQESKKLGKLVDKVIYIYDLQDLTFAKFNDREVFHCLMDGIPLYQNNYPETLETICIIHAPVFFNVLLSVVKTVLDSRILQKVKVYSDDSWKDYLLEKVDAEVLPASMGGKRTDPDGNPSCNTIIYYGGLVPEKYYKYNIKQSFLNLQEVEKITISRAAVHEICLQVKEPATRLEWEFYVKSGDIKFGILYQNGQENKTEVVPLQRITTDLYTETGIYECENIGRYIIIFDNSYSYLRSKEVFCKIQIMP